MPAFVIEYRSPTIQWERIDHLAFNIKDKLQELRTNYVTVPVTILAATLEEATDVANNAYPNMVRKVYQK